MTLALGAALLLIAPTLFVWLYRGPGDTPVSYGEALHHVYFLMFGEPTLPYVESWAIELTNLLVPPLGIAVVADGAVRFAYLFFARHRSDKEWIEVFSKILEEHVVVCGAGRVGYRVTVQLLELGHEVVVVEKREDAAFVNVLRDRGLPVLIDDVRSPNCLARTNIEKASAIVCATDDDLANLNIALDARKANPDIRVVIRLFDDDLVAKVKDTFKTEAHSTSALAAPALALAALDPRIVHSFRVGGHLMVVSEFIAREALPDLTLAELRARFGALTLSLRKPGQPEQLHPDDAVRVAAGDALTLQAEYDDYRRLRQFTGEAVAPAFVQHR